MTLRQFFLISLVLCGIISACSRTISTKESTTAPRISKGQTNSNLPSDVLVHMSCPDFADTPSTQSVPDRKAEFAITLKDIDPEPDIEFAVLDSNQKRIDSTRGCTNDPATLLIKLDLEQTGTTLHIRENKSGKLFTFPQVSWQIGKRNYFGIAAGNTGNKVFGEIEHPNPTLVKGEISELSWKVQTTSNGQWSTGPLPSGIWSIKLFDPENSTARWQSLSITAPETNLGLARLTAAEHSLSPLWQGVLRTPRAIFVLAAPLETIEVRISLASNFAQAFWKPFKQLQEITIPTSGRHLVYAQFRNGEGSVSELHVHEFSSEVIELDGQADAVLAQTTVSVFNPSTTVTTTPPAGATQHSITIDVDGLSREWINVDTPLTLSLPKSLASCGRHSVFIRFRDSRGLESESLTRTWNVSCWENTVPDSPLASRYGHGAVAIKLNPSSPDADATLIWGGRNNNQLFGDGAILKKDATGWIWETLPQSPLSPRTRPNLAVGKNHIFVHGGEDLTGNPLAGWALLDLRTRTWISENEFNQQSAANPPAGLKKSSVAYVTDLNTKYANGMFVIVGGEKSDNQNGVTVSDKYHALFELNGEIRKTWEVFTAKRATSRATSGVGAHPGLFYVHGGISTPSGTSAERNDLSGTDFEISADLQVFAFFTNEANNNNLTLINNIYKAKNSRTGALGGHAVFMMRGLPTTPTPAALIQAQFMCVYGGQKYSDELPSVCEGTTADGRIKLHQPFCRRIYDSYLFAPVGRLGLCFEAIAPQAETPDESTLSNFYLAIDGAPAERRLPSSSSVSVNSANLKAALFFWSGMSPTGGEFLSDGKIYFSSSDRWVPITSFEAPSPRTEHTVSFMRQHSRIFVWGGRTAAGITSRGAFYAVPEN
jgi:hypothetical protein